MIAVSAIIMFGKQQKKGTAQSCTLLHLNYNFDISSIKDEAESNAL